GKVQFIKDNCIVKTEKTACGACSEACPTKAVYMVPYEGNLLIPETNADICIGCGHCEYACPTVPYKAIFVDGNPVHQAAQPPENEEAEMEAHEDFPF
ncbi:MAG TPA: 4Fe-4S dicluster domain-containing protein, partial [Bacteroidales bacterium]|nr:4Fe-4S dicluster domain-containing protein [Bacteroidales bacterium]